MRMASESRSVPRLSFQVSLDRARPHIVDQPYRDDAAVVRYRYTDNGEQVCVPNTWNNLPSEQLIQAASRRAEMADQRAAALEENPPEGIEPEAVQVIVGHYRRKAARLRAPLG